MALFMYIDDLVFIGNKAQTCAQFKEYLSRCLHMKDLAHLRNFLIIEVARGPKGLFLSRRKYALKIIDECGMLGLKPVHFPTETNYKLALATRKHLPHLTQYRR